MQLVSRELTIPASRPAQALVLLLAAAVVSGCARREAQFTPRAEVSQLMPEAQQYLNELLAQNFGTPTQSVAWERFPIHYHAATGTIAAVTSPDELTLTSPASADEEESPGALQQWLNIRAADPEHNEPGMEVLIVSGALLEHAKAEEQAGRPVPAVHVKSYDPDTHSLVLTSSLPATPQPGDRIIIGPGEMLRRGRMLYAEHCQHCHGVSGDGNGPTAEYLNPRPRDYRSGIFKFTSTHTGRRPQRSDLARIIEEGIPGTYMPSFKLLTQEESTALVEYVIWLSCRGEAELRRTQVLALDFSQEALTEDPQAVRQSFADAFESQFATDFDDEATQIAEAWQSAHEDGAEVVPKTGRPPATPESIARGREIFLSDTAKCATCHGEAGKGDGPQTLLVQKDKEGKDRLEPGLFDDWDQPIRPRDLTTGIYRGGRRPIDIYRRIYAGIKGTPMTGFGTSLSDEQIWDLVNYVMSIPFEHRSPGSGPFPSGSDAASPDSEVAEAGAKSGSDS